MTFHIAASLAILAGLIIAVEQNRAPHWLLAAIVLATLMRFEGIVASVARVATILGEITAASTEQSSGIEHINRAVAQMDEMTRQNAALVEEAAAAAETMHAQAGQLAQSVAVFRMPEK